jgi:hypothetical protein
MGDEWGDFNLLAFAWSSIHLDLGTYIIHMLLFFAFWVSLYDRTWMGSFTSVFLQRK